MSWNVLFCLLATILAVNAEIRPFSLLLEPASEYIHYVEGYLVAPGYIDLSKLRFFTVGTGDFTVDDDAFTKGTDDKTKTTTQDDDGVSSGGSGGGRRHLDQQKLTGTAEKSEFIMEGSALDIAVFQLPSDCSSTRQGCDWVNLGVGARTDDGVVRYCCSNEAIDLGLCAGTTYGRLIMDGVKFSGKHRLVNIPATGEYDNYLKYGKFEEREGFSGKYAIIFANCNDSGRPVIVEGVTEWKSRFGYLPGDLFGLMYFLAFLFFIYFGLMLWYGIGMKIYEEAKIPIQGWILATIAMGCLEVFFRTGDLFLWNEEGNRFWAAFYIGVVVGVLKRGISRCLIVMVSLGWGVIRDDLGSVMHKIHFLGGVYIAVALVRDIMTVVAYTEVQKISQEGENELFDIVSILTLVIALVDVLFYLWIIDSLNATMEYLEGLNQTSKLRRYLRLRSILLFSILFAVIWSVFGIVDSYDQGIVDDEQEWIVDASTELNYIFVLAGVAFLWRPQPNAKDYAFVMQLPSSKADEEDGEGEGEFEMAVVPSALDGDDDDEDEVEMFTDEPER